MSFNISNNTSSNPSIHSTSSSTHSSSSHPSKKILSQSKLVPKKIAKDFVKNIGEKTTLEVQRDIYKLLKQIPKEDQSLLIKQVKNILAKTYETNPKRYQDLVLALPKEIKPKSNQPDSLKVQEDLQSEEQLIASKKLKADFIENIAGIVKDAQTKKGTRDAAYIKHIKKTASEFVKKINQDNAVQATKEFVADMNIELATCFIRETTACLSREYQKNKKKIEGTKDRSTNEQLSERNIRIEKLLNTIVSAAESLGLIAGIYNTENKPRIPLEDSRLKEIKQNFINNTRSNFRIEPYYTKSVGIAASEFLTHIQIWPVFESTTTFLSDLFPLDAVNFTRIVIGMLTFQIESHFSAIIDIKEAELSEEQIPPYKKEIANHLNNIFALRTKYFDIARAVEKKGIQCLPTNASQSTSTSNSRKERKPMTVDEIKELLLNTDYSRKGIQYDPAYLRLLNQAAHDFFINQGPSLEESLTEIIFDLNDEVTHFFVNMVGRLVTGEET